MRGATAASIFASNIPSISIHAPRAGSDCKLSCPQLAEYEISIHAPRAGSDFVLNVPISWNRISIHAPRAGSDVTLIIFSRSVCGFQSTLPVRGATTWTGEGQLAYQIFQSTLPVRGATGQMLVYRCNYGFQSTLPVRGATANSLKRAHNDTFQSTLPVRGATKGIAEQP